MKLSLLCGCEIMNFHFDGMLGCDSFRGDQGSSLVFVFVLIILYSLYLEYDSPFIPSAPGYCVVVKL
jgi:hypothetical protein